MSQPAEMLSPSLELAIAVGGGGGFLPLQGLHGEKQWNKAVCYLGRPHRSDACARRGDSPPPSPYWQLQPIHTEHCNKQGLVGVTGTTLTFTLHCLLKGTYLCSQNLLV